MPNMKVEAAAEYLALSASTLNKWRIRGEGPRFLKLGRAVVYRLQDLDDWLGQNVRNSTSHQ